MYIPYTHDRITNTHITDCNSDPMNEMNTLPITVATHTVTWAPLLGTGGGR